MLGALSSFLLVLARLVTSNYMSSNILYDTYVQVDIGLLAACFTAPRETIHKSFCVVQQLEHMDSYGIPVCNEYDCPLLTLSNLFRCIPSICISHSVSVVHECSASCVFRRIITTAIVERRRVQTQKLSFVHDFSNNLYALNIYCMHSIYS